MYNLYVYSYVTYRLQQKRAYSKMMWILSFFYNNYCGNFPSLPQMDLHNSNESLALNKTTRATEKWKGNLHFRIQLNLYQAVTHREWCTCCLIQVDCLIKALQNWVPMKKQHKSPFYALIDQSLHIILGRW